MPEEISSLYRLRQKYLNGTYSEFLDAITLARSIMPAASLEEHKAITSYILEASEPRKPATDDPVPM